MSNFNFNLIILGGHVASDVELRTTPSGVSVTKFTLAVGAGKDEKGEPATDFFYVTAWRQAAEFFTRYFRKGSAVCVYGEIHSRSWVDDKGVKRTGWEVTAKQISFVDAKGDGRQDNPTAYAQAAVGQAAGSYMPQGYAMPGGNTDAQPYMNPGSAPKFEEVSADDELPF